MAYVGKTDWKLNDAVMAADMNRIEQGITNAAAKADAAETPSGAQTKAEGAATAAITAHEGAADPHVQYVRNSELAELQDAVNAHTTDYEYQEPIIDGTQIQLVKQSDTNILKFKLDADLSGGAITVSLDDGTTSKPLVDVDGEPVTELSKGFVEVVEDAVNFTLRPSGGGGKVNADEMSYIVETAPVATGDLLQIVNGKISLAPTKFIKNGEITLNLASYENSAALLALTSTKSILVNIASSGSLAYLSIVYMDEYNSLKRGTALANATIFTNNYKFFKIDDTRVLLAYGGTQLVVITYNLETNTIVSVGTPFFLDSMRVVQIHKISDSQFLVYGEDTYFNDRNGKASIIEISGTNITEPYKTTIAINYFITNNVGISDVLEVSSTKMIALHRKGNNDLITIPFNLTPTSINVGPSGSVALPTGYKYLYVKKVSSTRFVVIFNGNNKISAALLNVSGDSVTVVGSILILKTSASGNMQAVDLIDGNILLSYHSGSSIYCAILNCVVDGDMMTFTTITNYTAIQEVTGYPSINISPITNKGAFNTYFTGSSSSCQFYLNAIWQAKTPDAIARANGNVGQLIKTYSWK